MSVFVSYIGDGVTNTYSVPFPYLDKTHVKVTWNDAPITSFTWPTGSTIQLSFTPTSGSVLKVYRESPDDSNLVEFSGGSVSVDDLNKLAKQHLYLIQEKEADVEVEPVVPTETATDITYTSGVSGFAPEPPSIKKALDLLAGATITEFGSNANGSFVKFANGFMVCYHRWQQAPNGGASYITREGAAIWTFPKPFTEVPTVIPMGEPAFWSRPTNIDSVSDYGSCALSRNNSTGSVTTTDCSIKYWYVTYFGIVHINAVAIGKWK